VALAASRADQRFLSAWQGYPSSLLLILLCIWHQKSFGAPVRWFRGKAAGKGIPLAIALCLLSFFFLNINYSPKSGSFAGLSPHMRQFHLLLLVPISEEMFFRGILLDHLKRGFGAFQATILCSALFMILHIPHDAGVEALVLSILTCLLVLRYGMLLYAVHLHVAWNAFVVARQATSYGWFIVIIAALAIVISSLFAQKTQGSHAPA
jgi:membrane protease YdiL (CAAX protease family)